MLIDAKTNLNLKLDARQTPLILTTQFGNSKTIAPVEKVGVK